MTTEEIIELCRQRGEIDFLFNICKVVAESDSIGEAYSYCNKYTSEMFNDAKRHHPIRSDEEPYFCDYIIEAGAPIYELHLKQIKVL